MKGELLNKMLVLATNKHSGQFDKAGKPYILHCLAVMYLLNSDDEELQCIALGHDLVEDTDVSYFDLNLQFSERIVEGISALTKQRGETPEEYLSKINCNKDAIRVKLADLTHNSDIRRLKGVTEKDIKRTVKYHEMYLELSETLKEFK